MSATHFFRSSIGKKFLVGFTGLMLAGFTLMHMSANMLIIFNPEAYNKYSHGITANPLILYGGEAFLLLMLLIHFKLALQLTFENSSAHASRPGPNPRSAEKNARFGSRSMILSGLLVLVFLVLHLYTFKYGTYYSVTYDGVEMRDLHKLVLEKFQHSTYVGWYLFSLVVLGIHLSHGLSGLLQTVGIGSVRNRAIQYAGWLFAVLIAGGFITQPIYVYLMGAH